MAKERQFGNLIYFLIITILIVENVTSLVEKQKDDMNNHNFDRRSTKKNNNVDGDNVDMKINQDDKNGDDNCPPPNNFPIQFRVNYSEYSIIGNEKSPLYNVSVWYDSVNQQERIDTFILNGNLTTLFETVIINGSGSLNQISHRWMILYQNNQPVFCQETKLGYWPLQPFLMPSLWGQCTFIGEEKLNGQTTDHFQFVDTFGGNETFDYWVSESNELPVRLTTIQTQVPPPFSQQQFGESKIRNRFFENDSYRRTNVFQQFDYLSWTPAVAPNTTFQLPQNTPPCSMEFISDSDRKQQQQQQQQQYQQHQQQQKQRSIRRMK